MQQKVTASISLDIRTPLFANWAD